jgi:hypothetical protein
MSFVMDTSNREHRRSQLRPERSARPFSVTFVVIVPAAGLLTPAAGTEIDSDFA